MPSAIVSIPLDDTEVPDIIEVTPTHPTIPRRGTGRSTRRPSAAQAPRERSKASTDSRPDRFRDTEQKKDVRAVFARPILDVIDEDYISEDDPDYTADVDDDDLANDDVFDGEADDGFGNHATDAHLQATRGPSESAPFVVSDYKIANVVSTQDEDVLIDSDFVESENLGESDPGSTVETEEEGGEDEDFSSWRVVDIRQWLRSQRVPFNPGGRKVELVSIARARKLEIEARGGEQYDEDDEDDEDDAIAPNRPSRQELHSRGRISAPSMSDDDDGAGHSRPIQRRLPGRQHTATRDNGLFGFNGTQKRRRDPLANRRVSAIITVFLLGSFLLCSAVFAISMLHQLLVMPYCDTGSMTSKFCSIYIDTNGKLIRAWLYVADWFSSIRNLLHSPIVSPLSPNISPLSPIIPPLSPIALPQ